jgi:hypothetical protein
MVEDMRDHRALLVNLLKRARFCLAHRINETPQRREPTGGDEALSRSYFEAAAGGAVQLGSGTSSPECDECFRLAGRCDPAALRQHGRRRPPAPARATGPLRADSIRGACCSTTGRTAGGASWPTPGSLPCPPLERRLAGLTRLTEAAVPSTFLKRERLRAQDWSRGSRAPPSGTGATTQSGEQAPRGGPRYTAHDFASARKAGHSLRRCRAPGRQHPSRHEWDGVCDGDHHPLPQ